MIMAKKEALSNFIPISRKLFEHRFWSEERVYSKFEAWIDLIQFARFEDEKRDFGSKVVTIERGQCVASSRFLSNRWGWSRTKVETFLKLLEDDTMIEKSHKKDIGQTIITICNYDVYNKNGKAEKPTKEPPQSQHKATVEPNINKDNIVNTDNIIPPIFPPSGGIVESETWRTSYEVYKDELREAYARVLNDQEWVERQQRYHPNLDIMMSLEKACVQFWALEAGWRKKKASKTENIDWEATFRNALNLNSNQVYKQK